MNLRHGHSGGGKFSPTYYSWRCMKQRCNDLKHKSYSRYGGRGIKVCERWDDFTNFLADMGERPYNKTLDRIDSSQGYSPENCRWATIDQQNVNRRGFDNTSGHRGVYSTPSGKWKAEIKRGGKNFNLGTYKDKVDAIQARLYAEEIY